MTDISGISDNSFLIKNALQQKQSGNLGVDLRGLNSLSKDEKIRQISIQFEQMFVKTLLKDVFKDGEKESGFSMGSGTLTDFRHSLFSQYITENGGLGYQEIIEKQIREKYFSDNDPKTNDSKEILELNKNLIREYHKISGSSFGENVPNYSSINNFIQKSQNEFTLNINNMTKPVNGTISSDFGWRKDPFDHKERFHSGIDISVPQNSPVKSFMDGEVIFSGWKKGYGNLVEIKHGDGYLSKYGHNKKLLVKEGDKVKSGTVISLSGSSGRSTGPHLHFEINHHNKAIDPANILP